MAQRKKERPTDAGGSVRYGRKEVPLDRLPMGRLLIDREGRRAPESVSDHGPWSLRRRTNLPKLDKTRIVERLTAVGITSPVTLAAMAVTREDPRPLARQLGLTPSQTVNLMHQSLDWLTAEERESLVAEASKQVATGAIEEDDPEYRSMFREEQLGRIPMVDVHTLRPLPWAATSLPTRAVDHRPLLGPARDQNPRGTCYAFGATAVREYHENARAGRGEKIDLSEEFVVWHRKKGGLFTAGGGDGIATLAGIAESGVCREQDWPYINEKWGYNDAHVPAPVDVLPMASLYRGGAVVHIPARDVAAAKAALALGKVVAFHGGTNGLQNASGEFRLPNPGESFAKGGHVMALIGYADSDDVPAEWGGGYFVVRNSWGDRPGLTNIMGPEYGGHLRMPYTYYANYTSKAGTFADDEVVGAAAKSWLAEYYTNPDLEGSPWLTTTVDQIAFEWGSSGPLSDWINDLLGGIVFVDLPEDHFSARWTTARYFDAGWYTFETTSDDGIRVFVDDRLVINEWHPQPATHVERDHYVPAGVHVLKVEYYERTGHATATFSYSPRSWTGTIHADATGTGPPIHTFTAHEPAMEWRHVPPVDVVDDRFSVRLEGHVSWAAQEMAIFHALGTGGVRISVDDTVVLDNLTDSSGPYESPPTSISAGPHKISVIFSNRETSPAVGERGIFESGFRVGWYASDWAVSVHRDPGRAAMRDVPPSERRPDHDYQMHRGKGLAGQPIAQLSLPDLDFPTAGQFDSGLGLTGDTKWVSFLAHRRYVSEGRRHRWRLAASNAFRFIVDGRCVIDNFHGLGPDTYDVDVDLTPGVHDLAVEYYRTAWGARCVLSDRSDHMWTAKWYANRDLSGSPAATTECDLIDFDWGTAGPDVPGIASNQFSATFETTVWLRRGRYRFVARSDDGLRLFVDHRLVIDSWFDRADAPDSVEIDLAGGGVPIRLEYYERSGRSSVSFDFYPIGFLGAYYAGRTLGRNASNQNVAPPVLYRYERFLDFDWSHSPPDPRLPKNDFSARWTGQISLPVGRYELTTTSDDGVRLLVDGVVAIDRWHDQPATAVTRAMDLVGRDHEITLEYYERAGVAECRLAMKRIL